MRDEQKKLTHERLVTAGHEVFARYGYFNTTINDITDAADVNRATFYQHFAGKPEIFHASIEFQLAMSAMEHWKTLDGALATGSRTAIRAWLCDAANWWIDNASFISAWNQATSVDQTLRESLTALYDRIGNSLVQYQELLPEGVERRHRVLLVEMLVIQLNGVFTEYLQPDSSDTRLAEVLDVLTDIWCKSLRVAPDTA